MPDHTPSRLSRSQLAAGILGFLGVAAGAFGAHGLQGHVTPRELEIWQTASHYQLLHAVALLALPALAAGRCRRTAAWCWTLGTLIFSGSLYLLVLSGISKLGMITPIGGLLFLAGWAAVAAAAFARRKAA